MNLVWIYLSIVVWRAGDAVMRSPWDKLGSIPNGLRPPTIKAHDANLKCDVNLYCTVVPTHFNLLIFSQLTLLPFISTLKTITIIACASAIDVIGFGLAQTHHSQTRTMRFFAWIKQRRYYHFNGYCVPHYCREMFNWTFCCIHLVRSLARCHFNVTI